MTPTPFILANTVQAAFTLMDAGTPAAARSARHALRHVEAAAGALMDGSVHEARSWSRLAGNAMVASLAAMAFRAPELAGARMEEP